MSSTTQSKPTGEGAAPAPPVFSYAQAAKGRAAATAASAVQSHQSNTSGINTPARDTVSTINTPSGGSERGDRSVSGSYDAIRRDSAVETTSLEVKGLTPLHAESSPTSPSFASASTTLKDDAADKDDDFILVVAPGGDSGKDRTSQGATTSSEKAGEVGDVRRSTKKAKKDKKAAEAAEKEAEKEKEELKLELLVPAPLPAVNFWQQRKETLAKSKPSPTIGQSVQSLAEASPSKDPSSPQSSKTPDSRRRIKQTAAEDGAVSAYQNGGPRETPGKGQRKGNEGQNRPKDDQSNKRNGPRGGRVSEKEEKVASTQAPPPVEDAMAWPTPETALEEEKRKVQEKMEREEKDEGAQNKPRQKEKWVPVPYVPSVTFNTQLPTRGGRGRGGARSGGRTESGRLGHTQNGGPPGEKSQGASGNQAADSERQDERENPRSTSLPPVKRQSTDQTGSRKASAAPEKAKLSPSKTTSNPTEDLRISSGSHQLDQTQDMREQQFNRSDISRAFNPSQNPFGEPNSRSIVDRRSEGNLRGPEQFKDIPAFGKDGNHQSRDRPEGRADRGRGGFRGRGGHPNTYQNGQTHPQSGFTNGHGSHQQNGFPIRQASAPYSPPLQQNSFNGQFPPPSRGGRGGSRSQSIPNLGMYGRFPPNGAAISGHMAPLQTFGYEAMPPMPYTNYIDQASVLAMVSMQLEYYFSIDNLCKDVYLRKHMDSQGFVFLSFIAGFKRIQALTHEFELLRFACQESDIIELVRGEDGVDRLRRSEGWEKWVLGTEERDPSAQNAGPSLYQRPQQIRNGQHFQHMIMSSQHSLSPQPFSPTGNDSGFRSYANGMPAMTNGNGVHYQPETPLSAAVPDFSPGLLPLNGLSDPLAAETTFHDDEVANLTLVFNNPKVNDESKPARVPFHNSSSRTFSNGSIDGRTIAEEMHEDSRQGRALTNGTRGSDSSPDDLRRSRSPFAPLSPTKTSNPPPVMWVKGQRQQVVVSEHNSKESYLEFRGRALQYRLVSSPGETHPDMKLLYEFWSHFLCRNFNSSMYAEFRQLALEDARNGSLSGVKNLVSYYDEILNSKRKVIPATLAQHYVEVVKDETSEERPAFQKLRNAWRNGALDMKSRKKIDNFVDAKLREELERGVTTQKSDLS